MRGESLLTVKELIAELECMDPNMPVVFGYNAGDYWQTNVAQGVEEIAVTTVQWSDYHEMWKQTAEYDDDEDIDGTTDDVLPVVVIR